MLQNIRNIGNYEARLQDTEDVYTVLLLLKRQKEQYKALVELLMQQQKIFDAVLNNTERTNHALQNDLCFISQAYKEQITCSAALNVEIHGLRQENSKLKSKIEELEKKLGQLTSQQDGLYQQQHIDTKSFFQDSDGYYDLSSPS